MSGRPASLPLARVQLIASVAVYIAVLSWTYRTLVAPAYTTWGNGYTPPPLPYLVASWTLSLLPACWVPLQFRRPSLLLFYIQWLLLFVPASLFLYDTVLPPLPRSTALELILLMFAGLTIIQATYLAPLVRIRLPRLSPALFWGGLLLFGGVLMVMVVATLGRNFRLANLEEIYSVRSAAAELVQGSSSPLAAYAVPWLAGFVLPFLFATAVFCGRRWWVPVVALVYVLLFGVGGAKTLLLSMVFIPGIYFVVRRDRGGIGTRLALGVSALLAFGALLRAVTGSSLATWYIAVVHFRTISVPPLLIAQYYDFFRANPLTYMSHVHGVNLLVRYPYDSDLPRLIGQYFYDFPVGSNAGLWAGDGLAGFGPPGIVLVSCFCAAVFWLLDCIAAPYEPRFVAVAISFAATSFANVPLTTAILSGGLGLLLVALLVLPRRGLLRHAWRPPPAPVASLGAA